MNEVMALANGHNIIMAMLINRLAAGGELDQLQFAKLLRETAAVALAEAPDIPVSRMDIVLLRNLAELLEQETGWTPTIVTGGKGVGEE